MSEALFCPTCRCHSTVATEVGGKLGMAAAGALLGGGIGKHPVAVLVGALLGALVGHVVDCEVVPRCQACGAALRLVNTVL